MVTGSSGRTSRQRAVSGWAVALCVVLAACSDSSPSSVPGTVDGTGDAAVDAESVPSDAAVDAESVPSDAAVDAESVPDGAGTLLDLDMNAYTRWRDVFDAASPAARSCLRDKISAEFQGEEDEELVDLVVEAILDDSILGGPAAEDSLTQIYSCLDAAAASHVLASVLIVAIEAETTLSDDQESCVRELMGGVDVVELVSGNLASTAEEEFSEGLIGCLPEAPDAGPAPAGLPLVWEFPTDDGVIVSPVVSDGVVIAGSYDGAVYALDTDTGELMWQWGLGTDSHLGPAYDISDGVVYLGDMAVDIRSGEPLSEIPQAGHSLVRDGVVYNVQIDPFREFRVAAVEPVSGETLWETQLPADDLGRPQPPTAAAGHLYVLGGTGIYALDISTGELDWTFDSVSHPPTVVGEVAYLMSTLDAYAVTESTGKLIWSFKTDGADMPGTGFPPVIVDDVWYFRGGDNVYALDIATGSALWSFPLLDYSGSLLAHDGTMLVPGYDLSALDASSGEVIWSLPGAQLSHLHAEDGVVYALSLDGHLHVIDLSTGAPIGRVGIGYYHHEQPYVVHRGVVYIGYDFGDSSGVWAFAVERPS